MTIVRLTDDEERRVKALCHAAWTELLKPDGEKRLRVRPDDLALLIKAGGSLVYYAQATVPGRSKKKRKQKPTPMWQAEVEYNQHRFYHESRRWFFVPKPKPKPPFPWGP